MRGPKHLEDKIRALDPATMHVLRLLAARSRKSPEKYLVDLLHEELRKTVEEDEGKALYRITT